MAYQYLTTLDLAKMNGSDIGVGLIEENLNAAPELSVLPARTISGTSFKALVRTAYPSTAFRNLNEGSQPTKSTYVNKLFETHYYDGQMEVDVAVARGDEQGEDHALTLEADGHGRAYLLLAGAQVWYGRGTGGDAKGFPGAVQIVDSSLVVDAGGTTDNTCSSVYAVCAAPKFMELIYGMNGVLTVGQWRMQTITRNSAEMTAWKNSLEGYVGCAWMSKYAVGRIKHITQDSGKGLTDALLAQLVASFPIGVKPTHLFMSRRSRRQLQIQRTVQLYSQGAQKVAPGIGVVAQVPMEYDGIPIIATDSIQDTEALAL